jgi:inorganic pyrophosphatase
MSKSSRASASTLNRGLHELPPFVEADVFRVVVESPRGSTVKLKYDTALCAMSISRPLALGLAFPYDWGFVPGTRAADGDALDAIVLWDVATYPGVVIPCRALALLKVEQNGEKARIRNDRLVVRPVEARREAGQPSGSAMTERVKNELAQFLIAATVLEGKEIEILGWDGPGAVVDLIRSSSA